jgi:cytoskeletal protein CcmA (bactofilin family)
VSAAPTARIEHPAGKAVIGPSVVIKGQIQSREDLTIEGQVEGTIEMSEHRLTVDASGRVQAGVNARVVEVQGSIQGQVEAVDKVYIRKGASFVGDIHSAGIVIEDGGYIKGNIDLTREGNGQRSPNTAGGPHARPELEAVAS